MQERLQKLLAQWGVASRRRAEEMIAAGRVSVNGAIADLGQKADPQTDTVTVDGQPLLPQSRPLKTYLLLHKPAGIVSTCIDPEGRQTVLSLVPERLLVPGLHPVGRLDAYSTGALILTNDGELTQRLTHPRHSIAKVYQVWLEGQPTAQALQRWREGVDLDGQLTQPAEVQVIRQEAYRTLLEIVLRQGRNRQIRRVAEALGHRVLDLHRSVIGPLKLGQLPSGRVRPLSSQEVISLVASSASPDNKVNDRPKRRFDSSFNSDSVVRCH